MRFEASRPVSIGARRTVGASRRKALTPKGWCIFCGLAGLSLALGAAQAQQPSPKGDATAGLSVGPATVAQHWSKYDYPRSVPEGAAYHIVERGDTLWDLSKRYLGNPYLWPQIWDQNRYVTDAHWIYPGDPLLLPKVSLVGSQAGADVGDDTGLPDDGGLSPVTPGAEAGSVLYPISEEATVQCAPYVVQSREDEGLSIVGSEEGATRVAHSYGSILYLSRGSNGGVKAGDVYSLQHAAYKVKHPVTGKNLGTKVEVTGWGRVILVTDASASVIVEQACGAIHAGDYLRPFEKQNVPLALRRTPPDRLTPPSGKSAGYVVDTADDAMITGTNSVVTIDLGSEAGLTPGNLLTVYRTVYPSVPTPRNVVGELAVLTVRERTATAKVMSSRDAIINGDQVELR